MNKLLHLESMTSALPWVTSTIPKAFSLCFSLVHITSPASGTASTHHIVLEVSRNEAGLFPNVVLEGYRYCPCFCGQHSSIYIQWKLSLGDQDDVVKVGCYLVTLQLCRHKLLFRLSPSHLDTHLTSIHHFQAFPLS